MRIDVYVHDAAHEEHNPLLQLILQKVTQMALDLTALQAAVAAEDTVIASAIALINGLPAMVSAAVTKALADAGIDTAAAQAAADAVAADVQGQTTALQAALSANTPATP